MFFDKPVHANSLSAIRFANGGIANMKVLFAYFLFQEKAGQEISFHTSLSATTTIKPSSRIIPAAWT